MNKVSFVLVNAVALGLFGCGSGGSGGSTQGSTSTAEQSAPESMVGAEAGSPDTDDLDTTTDIANVDAGPAAETETADSMMGPSAGDAGDGGTGSQGGNPGSVPDPVLGEVSSIDLSTLAGPAGYKIYSGDAIDPALPAELVDFVENRYINLEFPCSGEAGNIEVFPREFFEFEAEDPYGGTFLWETADPLDEFGSVDIEIATIAYGEPTNVGLPFTIDNLVNGSLIVDSGLFEDLMVTRIVQFDSCN